MTEEKDRQGASTQSEVPGRGFMSFLRRFKWAFVSTWLLFKWGIVELFTFHRKLDLNGIPNRKGHVAIVTGGTRGIGVHVVKKLLQCDFHVVLGCRNVTKGNELISRLRNEGVSTGWGECHELDLESFTSVRNFASTVLAGHDKIHLLVNNAGIFLESYKQTEDGCESHFQVNYFSHFLLSELLLPRMSQTAKTSEFHGRVVFTSSVGQYIGEINHSDLHYRDFYSRYKATFDCKLAQVTYCAFKNEKLQAEGSRVHMFSLHPGLIPTELWTTLPWFAKMWGPVLRIFLRSPNQGADVITHAAISPELENEGGLFMFNSKSARIDSKAASAAFQQEVWEMSLSVTNLIPE